MVLVVGPGVTGGEGGWACLGPGPGPRASVTLRTHAVTLSHVWLPRPREGTILSQLEVVGHLAASAHPTVPTVPTVPGASSVLCPLLTSGWRERDGPPAPAAALQGPPALDPTQSRWAGSGRRCNSWCCQLPAPSAAGVRSRDGASGRSPASCQQL